ncbi:unnamed protein product [Cladocopium goreaui]|uniref:Cyclin-L1 n=1 Tax=Cladocopium goreaui TaxID=2562237 RepID=A0A9P1BTY7_9DINO|nr:unnamed protein product [Cladocopium goreaui]
MEADRGGLAARVPEWLAQWMACPMPQEDDGKRLRVAKCSDPAVAALLCGSYKYAGFQNHGKVVYLKEVSEESPEAFYLYFWSDDVPDFQGWWFGPAVGGDKVVAFHPDAESSDAPPQSGWRVPFHGEVDPNFEVTGQQETAEKDAPATAVPLEEVPDEAEKAVTAEEVPDEAEKAVTAEVKQSHQETQETNAQVDGRTTVEAGASAETVTGVTNDEEGLAELTLQPAALAGLPARSPRPRSTRSFLRGRMLKAMKRVPKELIQQEGQALLAGNSGSALLDALRGLLQRYTATELFRCTASSAEGPASAATAGTVGMDDLDELLLRSEVTLPLEALVSIWHAALHEVGCVDVSKEAAPGLRLGYMQFTRAFSKGSAEEVGGGSSVAAPPVANFSFKAKGRHYRQDRHRRLPPLFSSLSASSALSEKWDPLRERSPGFLRTLTHLVSDLDEGSVRLGAQRIAGVFKERHRRRRRNLAADSPKARMADDFDLAEIIREWHGIKSSLGPRCVVVEYPLTQDWQNDVQVEEVLQTRRVHQLIDGVPSCSFQEFTDLVVVAVCEDGPAQRRGIKDGDRLVSIGVRSESWNEMGGCWHEPPQRLQTLAFEVNDASPSRPPTRGGLLAQLLMAAGGPGAGKEDFSTFVALLRGVGVMDTRVERMAWEAVQSFQCRMRQRCTRQEVLLALEISGAAPSEDAAECLVDALLETEAEQGPMRRIRKPQWTQAPSPSGAASLGALPDHMRSGCPICEVCGGRGHSKSAPHLVSKRSETWCQRPLPKFWGGVCGGEGHEPWQCPGLHQDPLGVPRCWKCLGRLPSLSHEGEHPEVNPFLAQHLPCEICSGLGHTWRCCPHMDGVDTVDIRQFECLRGAFNAESLYRRLSGKRLYLIYIAIYASSSAVSEDKGRMPKGRMCLENV